MNYDKNDPDFDTSEDEDEQYYGYNKKSHTVLINEKECLLCDNMRSVNYSSSFKLCKYCSNDALDNNEDEFEYIKRIKYERDSFRQIQDLNNIIVNLRDETDKLVEKNSILQINNNLLKKQCSELKSTIRKKNKELTFIKFKTLLGNYIIGDLVNIIMKFIN